MIVQRKVLKGRRSLCFDREALESRKEHKPEDNASDMAAAMGIELLTEEQYRELQKLRNFDSSNEVVGQHTDVIGAYPNTPLRRHAAVLEARLPNGADFRTFMKIFLFEPSRRCFLKETFH
jgi:hypothetical protein